jgi:hypothetical protein
MSADEQASGDVARPEAALVPGRACGTCTLCCKIMRIEALQKPSGKWCAHCEPGRGCGIYETRPAECRRFFCMWMYQPQIGPEWKPEKSKIVLCLELDGKRIAAHVDPGFPAAWRRAPYYGDLKRWSAAAAHAEQQVSVWIGRHAIVILPDRDVDLGIVAEDELVVSTKNLTPQGMVLGAEKIKQSELSMYEKKWAAAKMAAARRFARPPGE